MKMKDEIIAKDTIKPSSPTPNHLRTYHFSLLDQLAPSFYSHIVFFYSTTHTTGSVEIYSQCLKKSLSQVLTRFYPVAGRIKDCFTVDCNDEGIHFIEARINCKISDVFQQPSMETLKHFVPSTPSVSTLLSNPLLIIQVNFFECGGMALCISLSHKVCDAIAMSGFLKCWTDIMVGSSSTVFPDFTSATSLLPPTDHLPTNKSPFSEETRPPIGIMRRYVFNSSKIEALKARSASQTVPRPTRVEAVSSLICKCSMALSRSKHGDSSRKLLVYRAVNLRPRFDPPLSKYCFGNVIGPSTVLIDYETSETKTRNDLSDIVSHLRNGILGFDDNFVKRLQGNEYLDVYLKKYTEVKEKRVKEDVDFYILTSMCNMQIYETDFGWGKPSWVSLVWESSIPNRVRLMDTRDGGGIEAWISFYEEDIALFEGNPEWCQFASSTPVSTPTSAGFRIENGEV